MPKNSVVTAQTDFSAGEVDPSLKRDNESQVLKKGMRQAANLRILNTRKLTNRGGRRVLYTQAGRVDQVRMDATHTFDVCFGLNAITIRDSAGSAVFSTGGMPWIPSTAHQIKWDIYLNTIIICFPGSSIQTLIWAGGNSWSLAGYDVKSIGGQRRGPFYKFASRAATMTPSGTSGVISVTFDQATLSTDPTYLGTRIRYCGRQMVVTAVADTLHGTAGVTETLPPGQSINFSSSPLDTFTAGDVVIGSTTGARAYVTGVFAGNIIVQLLNNTSTAAAAALNQSPNSGFTVGFANGETIVGPGGAKVCTTVGNVVPQAVPIWDEDVFTAFRGYPQSVLVDQNRLIFSDIPAVPSGIAWSAVGDIYDFYVDADPDNAIFELAPNKARVFNVTTNAAAAGDEIVFTDKGIWFIPISENNPLKPGSVVFKQITSEGAASITPRVAPEGVIFLNYGQKSIKAVIGTGGNSRVYQVRDLTEFHGHLLNAPKAIAVAAGDGNYPERYLYVLNSDGTLAIGRFDSGTDAPSAINIWQGHIGWVPWSGEGTPNWVSTLNSVVMFITDYHGTVVAEREDSTLYLDCAMPYNSAPAGLAPPVGKGPLWFLAGLSVDLMDKGTRPMGTYAVDANGFLIPQNLGGEDFTLASLIAGFDWTLTAEPFIPPVQAGQDFSQRMWARRILRAQTYVSGSTGFAVARLYSGQSGPNLPTPGTVMKLRRFPPYNIDEDATQAPTQREQSYLDRPIGRAHDPRWAALKDFPGPLTIEEILIEVTI